MVARIEFTEEQFKTIQVLVQVGRPLSQIAKYFNTTPRVIKDRWAERSADPLVEWSIDTLVDRLTNASMIQCAKPTTKFKLRKHSDYDPWSTSDRD